MIRIKIMDFSLENILKIDSDKELYHNQEYIEFMKLIDIEKLSFLTVNCGPKQIFLMDSNSIIILINFFKKFNNKQR